MPTRFIWVCKKKKQRGSSLGLLQIKLPWTFMCRFVPCIIPSHVSCIQLCDRMGCSPTGSSVHGILQARIPEWVAIPFSRGSSRPRDRTHTVHLLHWQAGSLQLAPPGKPYRYIFFFILFSIMVSHNMLKFVSCNTVGLCHLSILYIIVCLC